MHHCTVYERRIGQLNIYVDIISNIQLIYLVN